MNKRQVKGQKISPIRAGIENYDAFMNIKPFINSNPTSTFLKLQKKNVYSTHELLKKRKHCKNLLKVTIPLINLLEQTLINQNYAIFLTDEEGYIIEFRSDTETHYLYEKNEVNLGIMDNEFHSNKELNSTSQKYPVIIDEVEHYSFSINDWTCCGVPLRNVEKRIIGLLEVMVPNEALPPHTLAILQCIGQTIEQELAKFKKSSKKSTKFNEIDKYILDNLRQAVIALDRKFNVQYLNKFGLELFNLEEDTISDYKIFEILPLKRDFKLWLEDTLSGFSNKDLKQRVNFLLQSIYPGLKIKASELKNGKDETIGLLLLID